MAARVCVCVCDMFMCVFLIIKEITLSSHWRSTFFFSSHKKNGFQSVIPTFPAVKIRLRWKSKCSLNQLCALSLGVVSCTAAGVIFPPKK